MRERRLGTPAGTVPRRDDTRPDTIGEVVDGRLDPRLHALACQMIAAEDDVDRLAPKRAQGAERCVDDACVRARREDTDAAASHARREESLVEDQGIRHSVPVAHRVVPDEPRRLVPTSPWTQSADLGGDGSHGWNGSSSPGALVNGKALCSRHSRGDFRRNFVNDDRNRPNNKAGASPPITSVRVLSVR